MNDLGHPTEFLSNRDHLGPWTTALDAQGRMGLSTFWQRRMAMISNLNASASRLSKTAWAVLALAGVSSEATSEN